MKTTTASRMLSALGIVVASVALCTACAPETSGTATPGPASSSPSPDPSAPDAMAAPLGAVWPEPPQGEIIAEGTVLDANGVVVLCLGAVADAAPPQCSGTPLEGWNWDGLISAGTADAIWGTYTVQGRYDGERIRVTQSPMPAAHQEPAPEATVTDDAERKRLTDVWQQIVDRIGTRTISTHIDPDHVEVHVVWDDGTLQDAADDEFGDGVVVVRSALQEVEA
ncbi:hypothetical protein NQ156_07095 [Microbacterium sp. zg.Y625]|uniref:hypothetical protein n=1 Tax=Microbacterium jiangjiandongii TaxID=3049071 RepID=UPI00214C576A|nr:MULTISPECIES: hypothetical protein [unclassified Microbacterium]MCR2792825.1 hypothetical protein [Microbacterium sp. zg.Y625]WIM26799.1 hypothetical protein QNO14_07120 [Microbacterium sp. zg-Y625]